MYLYGSETGGVEKTCALRSPLIILLRMMSFQKILFLVLLALICPNVQAQTADFSIVPLPKSIKRTEVGSFSLSEKTLITYAQGDKEAKAIAQQLAGFIEQATGMKLAVVSLAAQRNCVRLLSTHKGGAAEGYTLRTNSDIILLEGNDAAGLFYASQTLRKALPQGRATKIAIPAVEIKDAPRFHWRGAHLDVARHFVSADSVKRFIDMLALHGINRFHWHLTDDQGWRVEIKKYPLLTEVGSQRAQTVIGNNTGRFDDKPYGGFYTQKEIKDIVRYAQERFVTIVPEIDMPGHMQAALAAYPELGCTGGLYKVWEQWGVSEDVLCAGNPQTYTFIDGVLDEIVKLFPSEYIHIGGDECPKTRWEACPRCQAMIASRRLRTTTAYTPEEMLQSYVMNYAAEHLKALGRKAIGWDEILNGDPAEEVGIMSWQGVHGGITAAQRGHLAIMCPVDYLYFDYRQSDGADGGFEGSGGYLPIERVYSYDPVPRELSVEEQKRIIGVQANCWTEHLPTYRQVEYMELPRLSALSEVAWSEAARRDFPSFMKRLQRMFDVYRREGYNYCKTICNVQMHLATDTVAHAIVAALSTYDGATIRYTLDGSEPTESSAEYVAPISITQSCTLRAAAFRGGEKTPDVIRAISFNKATARPIRLLQSPHRAYVSTGAALLVDGLEAETTNYHTGEWIGFAGTDLEALIDLGAITEVSEVSLRTCVEKGSWIFDTRGITISGSADGTNFHELTSKTYPAMQVEDANGIYPHALHFQPARVRFLKVLVRSEHSIPTWHGGKGSPGFLFVDEICVK